MGDGVVNRERMHPATEARWLLVAAIGCALLSYGFTVFSWVDGTRVAAVRLGGAWLLGILLLRRPGAALAGLYLLAAWLALTAGVDLATRRETDVFAMARAGARVVESGGAYALLRFLRVDPRGLMRQGELGWLGLVAGIVAPAASGLIVLAIEGGGAAGAWPFWRDWWIGGAFGAVALLPVMLAATAGNIARLRQPGVMLPFAAIALAVVAVTLSAAAWLQQSFVLLTLPLLAAALRVGALGTAVLNLLTVMLLLAIYRVAPPGSLVGLAGLGFTEMAFYSALGLVPPLLVAVQAENRLRARRSLDDALERLRLITDNMPAAIGKIGADGRYESVNRRYAEYLGRPAAEAVGREPRELLGDAYAELAAPYVRRAMAGESVVFETRLGRRDLEVHYVPHMADGRSQGLFVLALDLTARKAAEHALFEEKERIQVTLDSIGDAVVACDTDMRVTLLNPIAEDMTGWPESEALGRHFDEVVRLVDLTSGDHPLSPLRIAMLDDRIVALQMDTALVRRDGQEFPIEDSAAPIHDRDGRVIGGVMVFHDISETRAMAMKMSHQAQHDPLTDLPNRVLLQDRLEHALSRVEQGARGALMFIDLDHFKTINDSLGHQVGDQVLQEVARRLQDTVRQDDTVSRQGGDEFVVLLGRLRDPRDAARVAEKVLEAMQPPVEVGGHRLHVSLSLGIALFPQDASDMASLMRQADAALYHAKHAGRGRYSYFTRGMSERAEQRLRLEHDLHQALETGGLFLVYQPKVRRPDGAITGMEALVRWRRQDGVLVPPLDFIPVAEESGLITQIDAWVMREACRQAREWLDAGLLPGPVAVNVSLARFDPDRLLAQVSETLADTRLPGPMLEVEFTESQMFADRERAHRLIEGLRALEVRIAIDDFGTGYSSLGYLSDHRFDTIKIDRSFVKGLPANTKQGALVHAIVAMAQALEADVVAEGVETAEQARTLDGHGCREMQGFLYSRPVDASEFRRLLDGSACMGAPG